MNENVVRNSIFSLATDGQVFTADFSCRYPIDVTVIDSVSPDLSNRVPTNNADEHVEIGLVRYEAHDYKTLAKQPLVISGNSPIVHMAAVIPDADYRDRYVLVEKCWTAGNQVLLDDFGCVGSENSFVYANGAPDNSPGFSLRLPNWSVEFMCTVVYCENDCEISCGGAAKKRYGRQADDLSTADLSTTQATPTSNDDQATTQSVFIPLETTPSMVLDEFEQALFESEKELLSSKTRITIKFGPFDWVDMVQTTEETPATTAPEVTQPSLDTEIERIETPQPDTVVNTEENMQTTASEEDIVKEVHDILEEIEEKLEEEEEKESGIPGWMPLYGIIGAGVVAFITGFAVVVKFTKCKTRQQPKLLN